MESKRRKDLMEILLQDYAAATKHFALAVAELQESRFSSSEERYRKVCRVAENAYHACERLRRDASDFGNNKKFPLTNTQRREEPISFTTERDAEIRKNHWQIISPKARRGSR
jgi:hypothetical protein